MTSVSELVKALQTYPGDAEMWLAYDPNNGTFSVHIHPDDSMLSCYEFWDGCSTPETYHPVVVELEVDTVKVEGSHVWRWSGVEWVDCGAVSWA